jgi:hypothetical protein
MIGSHMRAYLVGLAGLIMLMPVNFVGGECNASQLPPGPVS